MSKTLATVLIDAVVSITLLLMVRYLAPADLDLWRSIVLILQGVAVAYIGSVTYSEAKKADVAVKLQTLALDTGQPLASVKATHKGILDNLQA